MLYDVAVVVVLIRGEKSASLLPGRCTCVQRRDS